MPDFKNIKAVIFDYGGTLDTGARHWANVLWEGFQNASVPVNENQFREAYVFAERALAKSPIILPTDKFHTLLLKKVNIETQELIHQNYWNASEKGGGSGAPSVKAHWGSYFARCKNARKIRRRKPRYLRRSASLSGAVMHSNH